MLFVVDFFVCYLFIMMRMEDGVVLKASYTKHSSSHLSLCSVIRDLFRMIIMMSSVFLFQGPDCKYPFLSQSVLIDQRLIYQLSFN